MIKLHKMTWGEFSKHNPMADSRYSPDKVIPETYWFISSTGDWYSAEKGSVGWNIYDEKGRYEGYADTLKEIRVGF